MALSCLRPTAVATLSETNATTEEPLARRIRRQRARAALAGMASASLNTFLPCERTLSESVGLTDCDECDDPRGFAGACLCCSEHVRAAERRRLRHSFLEPWRVPSANREVHDGGA